MTDANPLQNPMSAHTVVWSEIPVRDIDRGLAFYANVLKKTLSRDDTGPNPMVMLSADDDATVGCHLYPGEPAADGRGPTIHFNCPDTLQATMDRVWEAGGKVLSPIVAIPVGSFFYCQDPDGNSFSIFELAMK